MKVMWYYLKNRKPVSYGCNILNNPAKFIKLAKRHFENKRPHHRRIRNIYINEYNVSTVFLGIDNGITDNDENPLVFETMIFNGDFSSLYCDRCRTHRDALKMHRNAVLVAKRGNL